MYTHTGQTAELVAKYRPPTPILTLVVPHLVSDSLKWKLEGRSYARQCLVSRGLLPFLATPNSGAFCCYTELLFLTLSLGRQSRPSGSIVPVCACRFTAWFPVALLRKRLPHVLFQLLCVACVLWCGIRGSLVGPCLAVCSSACGLVQHWHRFLRGTPSSFPPTGRALMCMSQSAHDDRICIHAIRVVCVH